MRAGSVYRCLSCGERSAHAVPCARCNAPVLDEHGNPPPPLFDIFRGPEIGSSKSSEQDLSDAVGTLAFVVRSLRRRVSQARRLRHSRRCHLALALTDIADASGPRCRIRGRIRLLAPADPASPRTAFELERRRTRGRFGSVTVETRIRCGRFLVVDDTGAALVDDDFLAILPKKGTKLPANGSAHVAGADGDLVEISGPAAWQVRPELGHLGARQDYRAEPRVLCFDGRPGSLVLLHPVD